LDNNLSEAVENKDLYFGIIENFDKSKKEEYIKDFIKLNIEP
jgi:hypothetical protein